MSVLVITEPGCIRIKTKTVAERQGGVVQFFTCNNNKFQEELVTNSPQSAIFLGSGHQSPALIIVRLVVCIGISPDEQFELASTETVSP